MSTLKVNTIQNTSGGSSSTPEQIEQGRAKAWINFNQQNTQAIRDSFNVSSITDLETGRTQVNFSTAFSNSNYSVLCSGSRDDPEGSRCFPSHVDSMTTSNYRLTNHNDGSTQVDWVLVCCSVFGD